MEVATTDMSKQQYSNGPIATIKAIEDRRSDHSNEKGSIRPLDM